MPSKGTGSRTQAEAKLNAAFKKAGFNRLNDRAYSVPAIEKAMKVYYKDLGIGALKKPASMAKGSLAKKAAPNKAAPKKAAAAKKPGVSKSGPRRASY
jgi:hypothetical protein